MSSLKLIIIEHTHRLICYGCLMKCDMKGQMCYVGPTPFFVKHIEVFRLGCSTPEQESEERKCNYERYRGLVQNDFASSEYPPVLVMPCLLCFPPIGYIVFLSVL